MKKEEKVKEFESKVSFNGLWAVFEKNDLSVQVATSVLELMAQWRLEPTPLSAVDALRSSLSLK